MSTKGSTSTTWKRGRRRRTRGESVEAGRAYVNAYVPYLLFVERLYLDASTPVAHGAEEGTHDA
ncbi:MAG TPA: hypothetical protein VFT11_04810 [Candidatus Deferrimicrobiaceae bacterium]|nr:hypothetical protein [Candidatus Deferrimicrobiaceae bacterium]